MNACSAFSFSGVCSHPVKITANKSNVSSLYILIPTVVVIAFNIIDPFFSHCLSFIDDGSVPINGSNDIAPEYCSAYIGAETTYLIIPSSLLSTLITFTNKCLYQHHSPTLGTKVPCH